jgi:hypothetical protein
MEAIALLILFVLFIFGLFIAIKIYLKFSTHPFSLIGIYLLGILLGMSILAINYWYLYRLNSIVVPFTATSGGELKFNFVPQYNGDYSVDIAFLNKEINEKYESCDLIDSTVKQIIRRSEKDCKHELIYRAINAEIGNHHFIKQLKYGEYSLEIDWGLYNHNLKKPALHIYEFHGIKNKVVPVHIKINTTPKEIQLIKPIIVIGPLEDAWRNGAIFTLSGKIMLFIAFVLPFIFSIILLLFKILVITLLKRKRPINRTLSNLRNS